MKIALPRKTAARFKRVLRHAGRREIGGILMGEQLEPGHFRIVDFSVDDKTGSAAHFVRSVEDHQAALEHFFSKTEHDFTRFNYLGEWHSHPSFSVQPSRDDILAMQNLVNTETSITFAALMIVRVKLWMVLEASLTVFSGDQIQLNGLYREKR